MFRKIVNGGSTYWINTDAINYIESDTSEPMTEVYFRSGDSLIFDDECGVLADTIAGTTKPPEIEPRLDYSTPTSSQTKTASTPKTADDIYAYVANTGNGSNWLSKTEFKLLQIVCNECCYGQKMLVSDLLNLYQKQVDLISSKVFRSSIDKLSKLGLAIVETRQKDNLEYVVPANDVNLVEGIIPPEM
jgi:hypothetical protein